MTVNAKVDGELRVRVLDSSGLPLPLRGFFWQNCEPIQGDSSSHQVRFEGDLALLQGTSVRLEVALREAQLYGFELVSSVSST